MLGFDLNHQRTREGDGRFVRYRFETLMAIQGHRIQSNLLGDGDFHFDRSPRSDGTTHAARFGRKMGEEELMSDPFDIDFKLLPPKLQMQLWVLALDANTSKVNLAYRSGSFRTGLTYNYGGNLEASLGLRRFTAKVGVSPTNGDVDLGLVFRGFKFGASASMARKSAGASFGYGASLLPFPMELSSTFNSAAGGLHSMAADIRSAPDNPLAWYQLHSDDTATLINAVHMGQKIAKSGTDSKRFGAGLRLNYAPQTGFTIYGGAQLRF